ncbi:MAG: hypothetical protein IJ795_01665 [Bacteroidales bacterium]|nr:hypothetical protein [Bacteroidales bacterium]
MKRYIAILIAAVLAVPAMFAQTTQEQFAQRYGVLVKNVGVSGVGVQTLLDKWEAAFPEDPEMFTARFFYDYSKCQGNTIVSRSESRYLGQEPVMALKDSLGVPVNYFAVTTFDDTLFGSALKWLDKGIQALPERLDLRFYRVSALVAYEKDSPDMACSDLRGLIDYNYTQKPKWVYPGLEKVDNEVFATTVQEYCVTFFRYASPACYEAFKAISEKMLSYESGNPLFMDNMGSYYLVYAKDNKKALSWYNKVLKKHPDDLTAISNCIVLARTSKNVKLEKKYLPMLIKYSEDENTVNAAKIRLEYLQKK